MDNIESKVANCILEISSESIKIAGEEYLIPTPTPATLILVSELVAQMPVVSNNTDNVVNEVLGKAKDLSVLGKIAATLILGAKRIKERRHRRVPRSLRRISELEYLSEIILHEVSNTDLLKLISSCLNNLQIGDFFVLTTSLSAANMLKRTKEVETASGE